MTVQYFGQAQSKSVVMITCAHFIRAMHYKSLRTLLWANRNRTMPYYNESIPSCTRSDLRWIEYDPAYERMWKDMARTVDTKAQEEKIRKMVQYLHDRAYALNIYSPLSLYAVNKEVNFVPQKYQWLRLMETSVTDNHWSLRAEKK